jgi:hypothetical protein
MACTNSRRLLQLLPNNSGGFAMFTPARLVFSEQLGLKINLAAHKTGIRSAVSDSKILGSHLQITYPPHRGIGGFLFSKCERRASIVSNATLLRIKT